MDAQANTKAGIAKRRNTAEQFNRRRLNCGRIKARRPKPIKGHTNAMRKEKSLSEFALICLACSLPASRLSGGLA
jgi:hypothetical protein